jgi:RNA polymerase sigma factor (sigma-70 family)
MPASRLSRVVQDLGRAMLPGADAASDGALLQGFVDRRDESAFAAIVLRHGALVWGVCRRVLGHHHEAEDAFQATFLVLARTAASIRAREMLGSWLYGVAYRTSLKAKAAAAKRGRRERQAPIMPEPMAPPQDPLQQLEPLLDHELARLPDKYRVAMILCDLQGKTGKEAARQLKIPEGTLSTRLRTARAMLAKRLERHRLVLSPAAIAALLSQQAVAAPSVLMTTVIKAAPLFAAGQATASGLVSANVAALTEGVLKAMLLSKIKIATFVLVSAAFALGGGMLAHQATAGQEKQRLTSVPNEAGKEDPVAVAGQQAEKKEPAPSQATEIEDPPHAPRLDRFGDTLPPGALNRLGSQRFRYSGTASKLAYSPDGKAIASACRDGSVRLFDAATGKLRWRLETDKENNLQDASVWSEAVQRALAFSDDGKKLAMLNALEYLVVDIGTDKVLVRHRLPAPQKAPRKPEQDATCSAIAPDLATFALGFMDGSIHLHDAANGHEKQRITVGDKNQRVFPALRENAIEFSADGKTLYALAPLKSSVMLFDTTAGKLVDTLKSDDELRTPKMAFSKDSRQLAVFDQVAGKNPPDSRLTLWDVRSDKPRHVMNMPTTVFSAAFSPDGKFVAVACRQEIVFLYTATGKEQRRIPLPSSAASLAFTPDGNTLAAGAYASITLLNVATGKVQAPVQEPRGATFATQFAAGGKQLISFGADGAYWWDLAGGQSVRHFQYEQPGGKVDVQQVQRLVDTLDAGEYSEREKASEALRAMGHDVDAILQKSLETEKRPEVRERLTKLLEELKGQSFVRFQPLHGHTLSPDEKTIVTRGGGGDLVLVDIAANRPLHTLKGHKSPRSAAFSPDGAKLYSAGDGRVIVWDVASGKQLMEWESPNVASVAPSPDGRWLAYWTSDRIGRGPIRQKPAEGTYDIRLWDVAAGKLARRLTPRGGAALDAVFSADSTRLVIVGGDPGYPTSGGAGSGKSNVIQIWDVAAGTEPRIFRGNQERVICAAISADGRTIATGKSNFPYEGSADYALRLWDVATGTERRRIQGHESSVDSVSFSPDGRWLASTSLEAPIYVWDLYALEKSRLPAKGLSKEDKDKLWQDLASEDAAKAFQAVCELIARPDQAVEILQDGWKRVPRATAEQMRKWVEDLNSNESSVRQKAEAELNRYLAGHEQLVSKALEKADTPELRRRLVQILNQLHPDRLRRTRMLEVLERIGSGPAREFLQTLAGQTEDVETSREASAGLERLKR